jgi:hypothetical protein
MRDDASIGWVGMSPLSAAESLVFPGTEVAIAGTHALTAWQVQPAMAALDHILLGRLLRTGLALACDATDIHLDNPIDQRAYDNDQQ